MATDGFFELLKSAPQLVPACGMDCSQYGKGYLYEIRGEDGTRFNGEVGMIIVEPAPGCSVSMPLRVIKPSPTAESQPAGGDRILFEAERGMQFFMRPFIGGTLDEATGTCKIPPMSMADDGPTVTIAYSDNS